MASLRHPHCLLYLGLCSSPPVLVMEFCPRGSLADVLRQAREVGGCIRAGGKVAGRSWPACGLAVRRERCVA